MRFLVVTGICFLIAFHAVNANVISPPDTIRVTFRADLSEVSTTPPVGIRGNWPPFSWERSFPMYDPDQDGIYSAKVAWPATDLPDLIEYKFVFGTDPVSWELEGENRLLITTSHDTVLPVQRWNELPPIDPEVLPLLSPEQLAEDFRIAQKALLDLHPGLYRYRTDAEIDSLFERTRHLLRQPLSYRQAYVVFSRLLGAIRCGHTYANFYNQSGLIKNIVLDQPDKLPLTFRIVQGRMIVTANVSGNPLPDTYPEITAINGYPVGEIIRDLLPLVKADGHNDGKRLEDLHLRAIGQYEAFDVYFPLLFPPQDGHYDLTLRNPRSGKTTTARVKTIARATRADRLKKAGFAVPRSVADVWDFQLLNPQTAYLKMGTFATYITDFAWQPFLDKAFRQISKNRIDHLILDIRGNEGGLDEIGAYLAGLLISTPLPAIARQECVAYQKVPEDLKPYLFTWDDQVFDFSGKVEAAADGLWCFPPTQPLTIRPKGKGFRGNVYLLVDAANSSATFYLAEMAKTHQLATLIGTTTGGNQKGMNGGQMFFVRLPNSKIEFDIPIYGSFSPDRPEGGIQPDLQVEPTVESVLAGKDPALDRALALIRKGQ